MERIVIVLADDHTMVRRGLRMVLEAEPGFVVAAEAGDVEQALRQTREHAPAVAVLDLNMPGTPTLTALGRFAEAAPGVAIVVLTMEDDPALARAALAAGARAFVLKEGAEDELVTAVRAAAAGRTYLDPQLGARLLAGGDGPTLGTVFAGHRLDAIAGNGGMGTVYRATDLALDRPVALKLIAPALGADPVFRARFEQESRLAASLDHPHVVPVYRAGEEHGRLFIAMRYVEGTDLRTLLSDTAPPFDERRAVTLLAQVADALDEAHEHGLVHRDVKPANILVGSRHGGDHAFLTDFGVSKDRVHDPALTGTGMAIGTAGYVAPEQAQGLAVDGRADVYALGCVLFQALAGHPPFVRESDLDTLWAHVHDPPPILPGPLGEVIATALAKAPEDRPATAGAFAEAALAALERPAP